MDATLALLVFAVLVLVAALVAWAALRDVGKRAGDVVVKEKPSALEPTAEELAEGRRNGPGFPH
jgi:membrane protein implicated in regulation of membrane protease activity